MIRILILTGLVACSVLLLQGQKSIYDLEHIAEVRITFTETDWHEQLDSLKERGQDERLIADVSVDGKKYPNSGIRYKGNSSYFNVRNAGGRKLPFNIKVNFQEKDARLPGGYETLKLSNVFRDPSFIREVLSYDIARKYVPAPRANYARVYINKDYMGLYNLSESIDNDFLKKFYGDKKGAFFKCDPSWDQGAPGTCKKGNNASLEFLGKDTVCYYPYYEIKSDHGWGELQQLIKTINQEPAQLEQVMNINETLWMLAYDNVMVNLDSYLGRLCHNYYLYQDGHAIWHPVLWDMNLNFGGFRYTGSGAPLSNEGMQDMSLFLHYKEDNTKRPLVMNLLGVDHYRKMYLAHVRTIVEENFSNGWYKKRAEEIRTLISEDVEKDPNRLYSGELYDKNLNETVRIDNSSIIGITELMDQRAQNILAHPLMQKTPPGVSDVKHEIKGGNAMITTTATDAEEVWVYYRTGTFAPWKRQPMAVKENDKWAAELALSDELQYYIVAENKYIATLSPARAAREFYEIQVK
jgi:hypothetical protein